MGVSVQCTVGCSSSLLTSIHPLVTSNIHRNTHITPTTTTSAPRGSQPTGRSLGKELHLAAREQAVSLQIPRTQGESTAPSLGKRTEQVGGLGLEIPPSSPSTVSLLWFQAASAPAGISRPTLASRKAASHLWGLGRRQRLTP